MITEVAIFTAIPGKEDELGIAILEGSKIISQVSECLSARIMRGVEKPGQYILMVGWTTLDAHLEGFRKGPLFPKWRAQINGLYEGQPSVFHYQDLEKE